MFEWIKDKFGKKESSYDSIRSQLLGEPAPTNNTQTNNVGLSSFDERRPVDVPQMQNRQFETNYGSELEQDNKFEPDFNQSSQARIQPPRRDLMPSLYSDIDKEPPFQAMPVSRNERDFSSHKRTSDNAEELDKIRNSLLFIKEQLAAIKAQNEIINERIKNLERNLVPERY